MAELEKPKESGDGNQDKGDQLLKAHVEINVGRQELVDKQKQQTEALKGGASSGVTGEFGKPLIVDSHAAPAPTRVSAHQHMEMVAPAVAKAEKPVEDKHVSDASPQLKGNAEQLLWDNWNQQTFKLMDNEVRLCLKTDHPDLQVPEAYRHLATDVPHLQTKYDVTVAADGTITKIDMVKNSGSAYFDGEVKRGIEHMAATGKLKFPEESHMSSRVLHISYGWNWKGARGYPTGQVEEDGRLHQKK